MSRFHPSWNVNQSFKRSSRAPRVLRLHPAEQRWAITEILIARMSHHNTANLSARWARRAGVWPQAAVLLLVGLLGIICAPAQAQTVTTTVSAGTYPYALAVNPVTNKIYVANAFSNNVTVIDGATNTTTTVTAGADAVAVAANPVTNKIYVANNDSGNVTVIDGATNSIATVTANARALAVNPVTNKIYVVAGYGAGSVATVIDGTTNSTTTVGVGSTPVAVAVNPVTNKVYVANGDSNNVTVIDGATNSTTTVGVGSTPVALAVNPVTNKVYVANQGSNNVTVIDGATNSTTTLAAGTSNAVAVNSVTNKVYVANRGRNNVTVIDGATNSTTAVSDPNANGPFAVAVDPVTNKIYVANVDSNNVTVIDGATNSTTTVGAGTTPVTVGVNPATGKIYVPNRDSNNVTVIDGATNSTATVNDPNANLPWGVSVDPATDNIYVAHGSGVTVIDGITHSTTTVTAGTSGSLQALAANPVTNKVYVASGANGSNNVTVIDGGTNSTTTVTDPNAKQPFAVVVNPVTNKIYVANYGTNSGGGNLTVIDGATNSTTTVTDPNASNPYAVAVNPVTNKIYVANLSSNNVTVIDGNTLSTSTVSDPNASTPEAVAVNPVTNKVYVANRYSKNVTVIDGATNSTTTITDPNASQPYAVAVNPLTNKVYVTNFNSDNVTVIDGATNATSTVAAGVYPQGVAVNPVTNKIYVANLSNFGNSQVTVIDGATNSTSVVTAGTAPLGVVVDPVTNEVYICNQSNPPTVTVISEQQVQTIPLQTAITPLAGNQTGNPTPTFTFSATDTFSPNATTVDNLLFQIDTWQGPWLAGTDQGGGSFTGSISTPLQPGVHILYAYTTDSQEATSVNTGSQSSPLIGNITAYLFLVVPPAPAATLSTASLSFGNQVVNTTSAAQSVMVTSSGNTYLSISSISLSGANSGDFAISSNTCPNTLAVGNTCTIDTTFTPSAMGARSATLNVTDNAADSPQTVSLTGTGTNPAVPMVTLSTSSLSFGDWAVGSTSSIQSSTLTNTGTTALSITSIVASGDFALATTGTSCPYSGGTVNAGASCTIDVTFTPTTTGTRTGTATVTDNAAGSPQSVSLSGTGVTSIPAPSGLQSWWPGEGNFNDIRGPNTGTSADGVTFVPGEVGQAFHFSGAANSYFTVPNSATFAPASTTVSIGAWIRPDFTAPNFADVIFSKRDACGSNRSYDLSVTKAGAVGLGYPLGTIVWSASVAGDDALSTVTVPQDSQFHFVVGTYDGANMNVYLDGALVGQKAHTGSIPVTSETPYIGLEGGCGHPAVADVDELQFYNTALSQSEITAIYDAANAGVSQNAPVPLISQPLVPAAVIPGSQGFTLTVNGTGFVPSATVDWNGRALTTTFISSEQLNATVPSANLAVPSTALLTVLNPVPGGGTSNVAYLGVTNPTTSVSFTASSYAAGNGPNSVAIGDFNGDGKLDLAVANFRDNSISVLLGNGDGTFQPAVNYGAGYAPFSVAAGDFNGDGRLDLAVADLYGNNISILLGNGDGTFQAAVNYPVGTNPYSIAVGDFNGDGKLDLAVANFRDSTISVLLGNGDGTFQGAVNYGTGPFPAAVAVGDFNGDGKVDLAVANDAGSSVSVLLGNGDGTFQAALSYAAGNGPNSVAVGDFNGDGKLDLAVTNNGSSNVSVLLGNGDGTFQAAVNFGAGSNIAAVAVGDFNGDGKLDLAVANAGSNNVSVLLGKGDGTFQAGANYPAGVGPVSLAVGDFNGDGRLDLAVANSVNPGTVSILLQAPTLSLSASTLTFGNQSIGTNSAQQPVTITNSGSATLTISSITTTGANPSDFAFTSDPLPISLDPGATTTIQAAFTPTATGIRSASLSITDNASSSPQNITLTGTGIAIATTTIITAPAISYGSAASVTISVTSGQGTVTGNVSLSVDNASPLTQPLSSGAAVFTVKGLAGGSHLLSASYTAQGNFGASSATSTQQVNPAQQTVTFTGAPASAAYQSTFTVTATTNASTMAAITASGACSIAGNMVTMASGTGTCSLTANWAADNNYLAASAGQSTLAVKASSKTVITSHTPSPSVVGQAVIVTFTVSPVAPASGTPTGNVTVSDGTGDACSATVAVGSCTLIATTAGTKTLTATYGGGGNFNSSASAGAPQTVNKANTATSIIGQAPNPSVVGQPVMVNFKISPVAPGSGTPTGNVTVSDGGGDSCTVAVAAGSCSLSFVSAGTKTLTASYTGDSNFNSSTSAGVAQNVWDFSISAGPTPQAIKAGSKTTYKITLTSLGGLTGNVMLSCGGVPPSSSCSISPNPVSATSSKGTSSTATIQTSKSTPAGTYTLRFTGIYGSGSPATGGLMHSTSVNLTVN